MFTIFSSLPNFLPTPGLHILFYLRLLPPLAPPCSHYQHSNRIPVCLSFPPSDSLVRSLSTLWFWLDNLSSFQCTGFIFRTKMQDVESKIAMHFEVISINVKVITELCCLTETYMPWWALSKCNPCLWPWPSTFPVSRSNANLCLGPLRAHYWW